jgi:Uma2 family endonuclease
MTAPILSAIQQTLTAPGSASAPLPHAPTSTTEILYPDSDGQPMADNTRQFDYIVMIQGGLSALFADRPDVFVAGDLLWYPVEGSNTLRAAPDAMVVFGRPPGYRGSYKQWCEDGLAPQVAFEVLSPGNTRVEMARKRQFYERYGVEEYYEYDPDRGELRGWLRREGRLEPIARMENWVSPRLGVRFTLAGTELVLYRPDGRRFETFVELEQRAETERQRAETERQRAETERQRGREEGLQQALERLVASGIAEDQARRLLGLE